MRRFLQGIVAVARDGGPDAYVTTKEAVDDDRLAHESFGLTAAGIAAVENLAPS